MPRIVHNVNREIQFLRSLAKPTDQNNDDYGIDFRNFLSKKPVIYGATLASVVALAGLVYTYLPQSKDSEEKANIVTGIESMVDAGDNEPIPNIAYRN